MANALENGLLEPENMSWERDVHGNFSESLMSPTFLYN